MGASENFWADMRIFEGEKDAETLTQKMATGEYVIIGDVYKRQVRSCSQDLQFILVPESR